MALGPVGLVERVRARVRLQDQGASGTLHPGGARHNDALPAAVLWNWQEERRPARHAVPLDIAIGRIELRLLVDKDRLRQRRDGHIVAPV